MQAMLKNKQFLNKLIKTYDPKNQTYRFSCKQKYIFSFLVVLVIYYCTHTYFCKINKFWLSHKNKEGLFLSHLHTGNKGYYVALCCFYLCQSSAVARC